MRYVLFLVLLLANLAVADASWVQFGTSPDGTKLYYDKDRLTLRDPDKIETWMKTSHPRYGEDIFSVTFDTKRDDVYWSKGSERKLVKGDVMLKLRSTLMASRPKSKTWPDLTLC